MVDKTIVSSSLPGGLVRYELGAANWIDPRIPDIHNPDSAVALSENRLVDVIILGDGFTEENTFSGLLSDWIDAFFSLEVYEKFAGAFRIRALYTPSEENASTDRRSFYRCKLANGKIDKKSDWQTDDDEDGQTFRLRLFQSVDRFLDVNLTRYPDDIDVSEGNSAINNNTLRGVYRNLVVCMLVQSASDDNVSGMTSPVPRLPPQGGHKARVAFGANAIHEFSHAFAFLSDEYIDGRGSMSTRVNPSTRSIFNLSNLSYSSRMDEVPWLHLSPWGDWHRQGSGKNPSRLVGWLWVGGARHKEVWHSEYMCLMNGQHDNFQFTQAAQLDPTWQPGGYQDETGASLRAAGRFCLWCQELVTLRILEKTGQFTQPGDVPSLSVNGQAWYRRWVRDLRQYYYSLFSVDRKVLELEALYAGINPGANGEPLWQSDLYEAMTGGPHAANPAADPLTDEERLLLFSNH